MIRLALKRVMDFSLALLGLVVTAPVMLVSAVIIRMCLGSPIFFRQERPGLHGKPFVLIKFRTMTNERDLQGNLLPDAERLRGIGRFLRRTSIDELPQLWNVLKGELSIVGPRPLLTKYLEFYTPEQMRRHDVKPGITGWAQIHGRNTITWQEKFAYDLWYVDNWSLLLDLKIILITVAKVITGHGVTQQDGLTMDEFTGNPD